MAVKPAQAGTLRKPKVNKRNENLNKSIKIFLDDPHNPSADSILLVGDRRAIRRKRKAGAGSIRRKKGAGSI